MPDHPTAPDAPRQTPATDTPPPRGRHRTVTFAAAITAIAAFAVAAFVITTNGNDQANARSASPSTPTAKPHPTPPTSTSTPASSTAGDHTARATDDARRVLRDWSAANPANRTGSGKHAVGDGPATGVGGRIQEVLRIPALGAHWAQPIYEGTASAQLRAGVGHFEGTEQPGQIGNFALAGHRSGVSSPPFKDVDSIPVGAPITVTTANRITYTYRVTQKLTVPPSAVGYIAQVPGQPNATPTKPALTIVTCWPSQGHSKRVVITATLTGKSGGL